MHEIQMYSVIVHGNRTIRETEKLVLEIRTVVQKACMVDKLGHFLRFFVNDKLFGVKYKNVSLENFA